MPESSSSSFSFLQAQQIIHVIILRGHWSGFGGMQDRIDSILSPALLQLL
jgi:hypothetical protein